MIILAQTIEDPDDKYKFERMYREFCGQMYFAAYKILHHHEDAEDAVHFAFEKIADVLSSIHDPVCDQTRNLLITVASNKARDIYRKNAIRKGVDLRDSDRATEGPEGSSTGQPFDDTFRNLPEQQQDVLFLKYLYGFSLKEIAELLDISLKYAQQLDYRGKKKLKESLEKENSL